MCVCEREREGERDCAIVDCDFENFALWFMFV